MTWVVRVRAHRGRIVETSQYATPDAAAAAYRAMLARDELVGQPLAAVFKPPANLVEPGNHATWFSRFDREIGAGRLHSEDPRFDPFATREVAESVVSTVGPARQVPEDWEVASEPLDAALKRWSKTRGGRDAASADLRVPRSTFDGWCAGRGCDRESTVRRLMTAIDRGF